MEYPVSEELKSALQTLYDDESVAYGLLGYGVPLAYRDDPSFTIATEPSKRILQLCKKFESYINQMAKEIYELGPEELPLLRAEATAFLIALREIQSHFPEIFKDRQI